VTARTIVNEVVVADYPEHGRVLLVLPQVPSNAPYEVREGIVRRRIAAVRGECPCGARADLGDSQPGEVGIGEVWHDRRCPHDTAKLAKALRRWAR
jgi:hypothetical protein